MSPGGRLWSLDKFVAVLRKLTLLPRRYVGVALAVLCWLLILTVGFFPTLLLSVFVTVGYSLGRMLDGKTDWQEWVERIWQSDRFD